MLFKINDFPNNDFDLYFRQCLVYLIDPEGKGSWVWYEGFEPRSGMYRFQTGKSVTTIFQVDKTQIKKYKIESRFPVGFFNTKESVVYCTRKGMRQNYKGLYLDHNFFIEGMEGLLMPYMKGFTDKQTMGVYALNKAAKLSPDLANAAFENPKYSPLVDALVGIRSRKVFSRALTPDFAITPHHVNKDYLLFFHTVPVAEIVSKANKVKVLVEDFRQELVDLLEPQGATVLT